MRHFHILGVKGVTWTEFLTQHPQLRSDLRTNKALSAPHMCTHAETKGWLARLIWPTFTVLFSVPDYLLLVATPLWLCNFRLHPSACCAICTNKFWFGPSAVLMEMYFHCFHIVMLTEDTATSSPNTDTRRMLLWALSCPAYQQVPQRSWPCIIDWERGRGCQRVVRGGFVTSVKWKWNR